MKKIHNNLLTLIDSFLKDFFNSILRVIKPKWWSGFHWVNVNASVCQLSGTVNKDKNLLINTYNDSLLEVTKIEKHTLFENTLETRSASI